MFNLLFYFYPRSPCGERQSKIDPDQVPGYFYPRSPCGERRVIRKPTTGRNNHFYPRSPCGERHRNIANRERQKNISIHALLAESDLDELCRMMGIKHFYPRSPCGERRSGLYFKSLKGSYFYPRSPCGERRICQGLLFFRHKISIHALLAESDA